MADDHTVITSDLKSFYASAECSDMKLDALDTNLVVADRSRTEKTICLAVSPSMKALGIGGRPRLFEVVQAVEAINAKRRLSAPGGRFTGKSTSASALAKDPSLELDYIAATPRMSRYMEISASIYDIYLNYIAAEDIHVYSIDEVFMDVTHYLKTYRMTAHELALRMIRDVLKATGITATAGIGTNLYLCKVAMDIEAKHMKPDKDGVRIAELDELSYRRSLWSHTPITDFWRIGRGYASRLAACGMFTMGDVARMSLRNERLLYELFGVNAELLIDHAWGYESCTMKDIKSYKPQNNSLSSGQVLPEPYSFEKGRLIVKEMADCLAMDLVDKGLVTNGVGLYIGFDQKIPKGYKGELSRDWYGRTAPKRINASAKLEGYTSSSRQIREAVLELYDKYVGKDLFVRMVNIGAANVTYEGSQVAERIEVQPDLFSDPEETRTVKAKSDELSEKERRQMLAALEIKKRFGKNAIVRLMDLEDGAKTIDRNNQIGGHKA